MKIGYISGVNACENDAFLEALQNAYSYMHSSNVSLELEVSVVQPELSRLYSALYDDYEKTEHAICEVLCDAARGLSRNGAQEIIFPYGAQLVFPNDYIMEKVGRSFRFALYRHMRSRVKGIVRRDGLVASPWQGVDALLQSERRDMLNRLGVMGLFAPADRFSSSDYIEEHTEKVSYSLVTPFDHVDVWKKLSDTFYGKEKETKEIHEFCLEKVIEMDSGGKGLRGLFVTDFWTENILGVKYDHDNIVGQITLPSGLELPVMNLERIEAWAIIEDLIYRQH